MSARGFTLIELMIVVAIVGVLSVVAGTAYRRYQDSGRTAEAYAMFGELRAKEESYRAEYSVYCNMAPGAATCATTATETDLFPALLASGEPKSKSVTTGQPFGWTTIGVAPTKTTLYCGYAVVAGAPGTAPSGTLGKAIFNNVSTIASPWFYMTASCDNDGNSATNAWWTTSMASASVFAQNEHK